MIGQKKTFKDIMREDIPLIKGKKKSYRLKGQVEFQEMTPIYILDMFQ